MATAEMDSGSEMAVTVLAESQTEAPEAPEAQETQETQETQEAQATREERFECHVCLEDVPTTRRWKECPNGAQVCHNCLRQQLVVAIDNSMFTSEGQVACPCGGGCGFAFDEALAEEFLLPVKMLKFKQRARTVLVERDPLKHWCPVPGCDGVATCGDDRQTRAQCPDCSTRFCAKCGVQHSGWVPCSMVADREFEAWTRSKNNVVNVFADGVKCCPACGFAIEKEGGCPHMSCSRCSHSFCWNCLSKWDDASYSCTLGYPACWIKQTWNMSMWGRHPATRAVSRAVGYPVVVAGGIGAAGAAVGLAVAAGAVALPVMLPVMGGVAAWSAVDRRSANWRQERRQRRNAAGHQRAARIRVEAARQVGRYLRQNTVTMLVFVEPGMFPEFLNSIDAEHKFAAEGSVRDPENGVQFTVRDASQISNAELLNTIVGDPALVVVADAHLHDKADAALYYDPLVPKSLTVESGPIPHSDCKAAEDDDEYDKDKDDGGHKTMEVDAPTSTASAVPEPTAHNADSTTTPPPAPPPLPSKLLQRPQPFTPSVRRTSRGVFPARWERLEAVYHSVMNELQTWWRRMPPRSRLGVSAH